MYSFIDLNPLQEFCHSLGVGTGNIDGHFLQTDTSHTAPDSTQLHGGIGFVPGG